MQLSNDTLNVLKNFSLINPSVAIKPGKTITTVSHQKSIMAKATIGDEFPSAGAIYDLNRFLGVLGLFEQPVLNFSPNHVKINGSAQSVDYRFADPDMIVKPEKDELNFPETDVEVVLTQQKIANVLRAANVMQLPEIAIVGDVDITLEAINTSDRGADCYKEKLLSNDTGHKFKFVFKTENLKLMNFDYNCKITSRGISQFTSQNDKGPKLIYWIAVEQNSEFS